MAHVIGLKFLFFLDTLRRARLSFLVQYSGKDAPFGSRERLPEATPTILVSNSLTDRPEPSELHFQIVHEATACGTLNIPQHVVIANPAPLRDGLYLLPLARVSMQPPRKGHIHV